MKFVKIGAGLFVGVVVVVAGMAAMQPDTSHVERSKVMAASPGDVYALVNDFSRWNEWSPWYAMEPTVKITLSTPPAGKGATYEWHGEKTGSGKMTITESVDGSKVVESLDFMEPFPSHATVTFTFTPEGDATKVVWAYDAEQPFMAKAMGLFVDMDAMLGGDFQAGLDKLAPLAESAAKGRIAAEEEARKAAEAAALAAMPAEGGAPGEAAPGGAMGGAPMGGAGMRAGGAMKGGPGKP